MSHETIIQMTVYVISAFMTGSTILWRIKELEKKVEKHNCLVERMVVVEASTKSAHDKLSKLEELR